MLSGINKLGCHIKHLKFKVLLLVCVCCKINSYGFSYNVYNEINYNFSETIYQTREDSIRSLAYNITGCIIDAKDLITMSVGNKLRANQFINHVRSSCFFKGDSKISNWKNYDGVIFIKGKVYEIEPVTKGCRIVLYDYRADTFGKVILYSAIVDEKLYDVKKGDILYFAAIPLTIVHDNMIFDVALSSTTIWGLARQIHFITDVVIKNCSRFSFTSVVEFKEFVKNNIKFFFDVEYKGYEIKINSNDCSETWCKNWFGL